MPRFFFWNLQGRNLQRLVARAAQAYSVDLIVLAECRTPLGGMLESLNEIQSDFELCEGLSESITIFSRFRAGFMTPVLESARVSIRRLSLPARKDILVAAAHLPSKLHSSDASLIFECTNLAEMISEQEEAVGHKRTILMGDFNVNPFEVGMVGTKGLHAVMSRSVALRNRRTVQGREYEFFYNPMWAQFGDAPDRQPGTYYYEKAEHVVYFWNVFDQVLIRPELLGGFDNSTLQVLGEIDGVSLRRPDGRPDPSIGSDHFPILVDLEF